MRGDSYVEGFKKLKASLKPFGVSLPILFKQYSELCYEGGVRFIDFGIDKNFGNCVDGLILVQLDFVKWEKKARYLLRKTNSKIEHELVYV